MRVTYSSGSAASGAGESTVSWRRVRAAVAAARQLGQLGQRSDSVTSYKNLLKKKENRFVCCLDTW